MLHAGLSGAEKRTCILFRMACVGCQGLLLRSELQRAIEAEDYAEAARLRDQLAELEQGASKLASSLEMAREDMPQQMYALGQRFVHAQKVRGNSSYLVISFSALRTQCHFPET